MRDHVIVENEHIVKIRKNLDSAVIILTVNFLSFWTDRSGQTVQILERLQQIFWVSEYLENLRYIKHFICINSALLFLSALACENMPSYIGTLYSLY